MRYRPAERGRDVGGDWYDVFELSGGRIGFAVGDVVGHDLKAAVAMGRLQQLLRYVAADGARAAEVLEVLDEACPAVTGTEFATLGYAEYRPLDGLLTYACAGHPPPLLVTGGQARYLNGGRSPPLGFGNGSRPEAQLAVPSGAMLVWYSDGLMWVNQRRAGVAMKYFDACTRAVFAGHVLTLSTLIAIACWLDLDRGTRGAFLAAGVLAVPLTLAFGRWTDQLLRARLQAGR